jgi:hypothetical protein
VVEAPGCCSNQQEELGEKDVRLSISVTVRGRSLKIMDKCSFETTIYEGLRDESRGRFFGALDRMLEDVKEGIGIKVNTIVPVRVPDWPEELGKNGRRHSLIKEPIPPYPGDGLPDELTIHKDTPLGFDVGDFSADGFSNNGFAGR